MPVSMDILEECFTPSALADMWVPMGDLVKPGWWVDGGDFVSPCDMYPTKTTYTRFGPYETIDQAIQKKNEQVYGRWRVSRVVKQKWGCGMIPYPTPGEYERV